MAVNDMPDPGFESEAWSLEYLASYEEVVVRTGARALDLLHQTVGSPQVSQATSPIVAVTEVGTESDVTVWVRPTSTASTWNLLVWHYPDGVGGSPFQLDTIHAEDLVANEWNEVTITLTPNAATDRLRFLTNADPGTFGSIHWYLDDVTYPGSVTEDAVARGMYDGWSALKSGLEGIDGNTGGYWNDFSDAVYAKLVLPEETAETPEAYICIPYTGESELYTEGDQHGITAVWQQVIYAFCKDTKSDPEDTESIKLISRVRDDILRYLLTYPTLGGAVDEIRLVSSERLAGWATDADYGELQIVVEIVQRFDEQDIGSDA